VGHLPGIGGSPDSGEIWCLGRISLMEPGNRKGLLVLAVALVVWAIVTPFMWRDLRHRTSEQFRGKKWIWWIASSNLTGSVAYFLFGRKEVG
jgi:hypothetical protein